MPLFSDHADRPPSQMYQLRGRLGLTAGLRLFFSSTGVENLPMPKTVFPSAAGKTPILAPVSHRNARPRNCGSGRFGSSNNPVPSRWDGTLLRNICQLPKGAAKKSCHERKKRNCPNDFARPVLHLNDYVADDTDDWRSIANDRGAHF